MAKSPPAPPPSPRDWFAKDVDELRAVWAELRTEWDEPETERCFFGRKLSREESGEVFERWLTEAFRLSGATGESAFQVSMAGSGVTREQIDGLVVEGVRGFLIEAKFWPGKVDFAPIALLHTLIGFRPVGTMGLFFSPFGYTQPARESAWMLRPMSVLLFNGSDLNWALPGPDLGRQKAARFFYGRMVEMVRRKWLHAARTAVPDRFVGESLALFNTTEG